MQNESHADQHYLCPALSSSSFPWCRVSYSSESYKLNIFRLRSSWIRLETVHVYWNKTPCGLRDMQFTSALQIGRIHDKSASQLDPIYLQRSKTTALNSIENYSARLALVIFISNMLCNVNRVVHSLDPGRTPSYSASHHDSNYVQLWYYCFHNIQFGTVSVWFRFIFSFYLSSVVYKHTCTCIALNRKYRTYIQMPTRPADFDPHTGRLSFCHCLHPPW